MYILASSELYVIDLVCPPGVRKAVKPFILKSSFSVLDIDLRGVEPFRGMRKGEMVQIERISHLAAIGVGALEAVPSQVSKS